MNIKTDPDAIFSEEKACEFVDSVVKLDGQINFTKINLVRETPTKKDYETFNKMMALLSLVLEPDSEITAADGKEIGSALAKRVSGFSDEKLLEAKLVMDFFYLKKDPETWKEKIPKQNKESLNWKPFYNALVEGFLDEYKGVEKRGLELKFV